MPTDTKPKDRAACSIWRDTVRRAQIVASHRGETLTDVLSDAVDQSLMPYIKKHGLKLPADAEPVPTK